ncbi:DUF5412 family protein [Bacillus sp. EAC]|uniref:DUF5412 family protein n=1 Tax=Bacillus sp. EAC TaxID=1978338 RepID=UPI001C4FC85F|nr:DUF5412 family protein [Bacillus sp. EAC]
MAKKYRYLTIGIIIVSLPVLIWISYHIYMIFFAPPTLSYIPKGKLIAQSKSPNQDYTLKAYVASGGATTDFAIRGELIFNKKDIKPKNIYWNYHEEKANIKWIKNDTVIINGHKLIVPNQTYDFRKE